MKIQIKHRFTNEVLFECTAKNIKEAVEKAVSKNANLRGADLSCADLSYANLRYADLRDANLSCANLSYANLSCADLSCANLSYANLRDADLRDANLRDADLRGADLSCADLSYANLRDADLRDANLRYADLRAIKHDVWGVLLLNKAEVPFLRQAITDGKVDGSTYTGTCACLCGTLAHAKGLEDGKSLPIADSNSLSERFFMAIKEGDTPETNPCSKLALEWVEEFLELTK